MHGAFNCKQQRLKTIEQRTTDSFIIGSPGNALNHKDVSTTRKVYAHSAHEAERTAREVAHKKMFEKNEEKEDNVIEIDIARTNVRNVEF